AGWSDPPPRRNGGRPERIGASGRRLGGVEMTGSGDTSFTSSTSTTSFTSFDLSGKVAVVTGGSRGLGRAMSMAFAGRGASVVIASRKAEACALLADEIGAATGGQALGVGCHVGRWEDCDHLVDAAYQAFGRVDVLVNNA